MQYELFYLVGASKEADLDRLKKEASDIVTSESGAFEEKQVVEKRRLAYEVKHEKFGFYVAQRFNLEDTEKLRAINKRLNLHPEILRFIISRAEELPELTSREERMAKEAAKPKMHAEKPAAKTPEAPKEKPAEEKKEMPEDIDKKLEEILNI